MIRAFYLVSVCRLRALGFGSFSVPFRNFSIVPLGHFENFLHIVQGYSGLRTPLQRAETYFECSEIPLIYGQGGESKQKTEK